jgi:N-acetylglucosaminyldiphosphoundecaprenol N-acetyl-beta-D-mannosaminyltransferase
MNIERFYIGKIGISQVNLSLVLDAIKAALDDNRHGYICVTNARTTYFANHDEAYCKIQNSSLFTVPDGAPLVWIAHNKGKKKVGKVSGKDLMDALFLVSEDKGYSHYFFGSTPETIGIIKKKIENKFSSIIIKGAISPPFQPIEDFDIESLSRELNRLKPTFFWCGLGAPKQEKLIALLQPKLENTICVGVGLAFEYLAESVKRAPKWMQTSGLEWLFRIIQQPKRINIKSLYIILSIIPYVIKSKILSWKR